MLGRGDNSSMQKNPQQFTEILLLQGDGPELPTVSAGRTEQPPFKGSSVQEGKRITTQQRNFTNTASAR